MSAVIAEMENPPADPASGAVLRRGDSARPGAGAGDDGPALHPRVGGPLHASDGGAASAEVAVPFRTSLAALLTGHILRDGEVVLMILKPSLWFIVFASMRFGAAGLIIVIAAQLGWIQSSRATTSLIYAATFLVAGRVMWAVLQWMARLYVLTDMRIVRLSGVFNVEIYDCALRKVGQVRLTRTFREKLWRLGSIEIVPSDDSCPASSWQTVKRPVEVHAKVQATVDRAKRGELPCTLD